MKFPLSCNLAQLIKKNKEEGKKSVLWRLLLHSSALGFTWETQPCNQLGSANQERGLFFLPSFLSVFLSVCHFIFLSLPAPCLLSFFLSFFLDIKISSLLLWFNLHPSPSYSQPLSTFTPTCKLYWERGGKGWGIGRENMNVFKIVGWNVSSHPPPLEAVLQIWRWWNI